MTPVARVIESLTTLKTARKDQLRNIFASIASRGKNIQIHDRSSSGDLIYSIADGFETGIDYSEWRFQTICENIKASYYEVWTNHGKGNYFLVRSYFHLYLLSTEDMKMSEYILLHCDASEPDSGKHAMYKQSPHIHIEVAPNPLPKAHFALYNGRIKEILKGINSFNQALKESIDMLNDQVLKLLSEE